MAPLGKLFLLIFASVFVSTKITVNGVTEPYPTNISAGLIEEQRKSPMSVENSIDTFPPNETSFEVGRRLEERCDSETCLLLCCSPGMAQVERTCVEDNTTSWKLPRVKTHFVDDEDADDYSHLLMIDDPCAVDWMMSSIVEDFEVLKNGSIYARNFGQGSVFDFEHHCLFRKPESTVYSVKVCFAWVEKIYWQIGCLIFVSIVMLVILIGYSVVPELRNLHGLVFRSYIATYIGCQISVLGQQFTADSRSQAQLFTFFVFSLHYFAGSCALWLNVMSFNIWRTFRGIRSIEGNTKANERKKFIMYGIYAWVTPAVLHITNTLIMAYVPYFHKFSLNKNLILWSCATLLTTVVICNTVLYSLTALRIRQHKKDTAYLANGMNKHHEAEKQWFNLHVKLFMITGVHTIMWVVWELWPTTLNTSIGVVIEVIQVILIFFIFIWKDNVKRSLRQRFEDTMHRLQSNLRITSHTTAQTDA